MKGFIFLIRRQDNRLVPALCVEEQKDCILVVPIKKLNEKNLVNGVYLGKPKGLKTRAVAMAKKVYKVKKVNVVKQISQVKSAIVDKCLELHRQKKSRTVLQKELSELKKRIYYAQLNNERYTDYEIRIDEIIEELGYRIKRKKKTDKAYLNYRETPYTGYIKIYHGGR